MQYTTRVKPTIYTYIITSDETIHSDFQKRAPRSLSTLPQNTHCMQMLTRDRSLCWLEKFHPRPRGGWQNFSHDRPLSGRLSSITTVGRFAPDQTLLPQLKQLLEFNFPGLTIHVLDKGDQNLKDSVQAYREYSMKYRGMDRDELQPARTGVSESSTNERQGGNREEM